MRADLQVLAERVRQYQQQMLEEEDAYLNVSSSLHAACAHGFSCIVRDTVVQTLIEHFSL